MCEHHADLPVVETVSLPPDARPAALTPGRGAAEIAGQVDAAPAASQIGAPLPPVAPAVAGKVAAVLGSGAPTAPEAKAPREVRVLLSALNRDQKRTLDRLQGDTIYLKGLGGNVKFKRDGAAVVLTLPADSKHTENTVIAVFQNYLNR